MTEFWRRYSKHGDLICRHNSLAEARKYKTEGQTIRKVTLKTALPVEVKVEFIQRAAPRPDVSSYETFIASKLVHVPPTGIASVPELHASLFPHQRDLVAWSLRRGRASVFAATGLGKSRIEVEWAMRVAEHTGGRVLMVAPLAVAQQTVREAAQLGVAISYARNHIEGNPDHQIWITNYDRLSAFNHSLFSGVVLDESSIIKHHAAKTLALLMRAFDKTAFKLCATATPAPNDFTELGTHAEFLGICTRAEMLAEFFCHDGGDTSKWRLKGHARSAFWQWVATWGALIRKPSDLGHDDGGYDLPPLNVTSHVVPGDAVQARASGFLFPIEAKTLAERRNARRGSLDARVEACAAAVAREPNESWIIWCGLNDESEQLAESIPGAVEVRGSNTTEEKEQAMLDFAEGRIKVLISKSSICGFGLNWQHCARMAFVGVTDSWESYYQSVRRCYRFGQTRQVEVHIFTSESEGAVVANLQRKEEDAKRMSDELSLETRAAMREAVIGSTRSTNAYRPLAKVTIPESPTSEDGAA